MDDAVRHILDDLARVAAERRLRAAHAALAERVQALKAYQQQRFRHTYADLLASSRYRQAALFFLQELYGPGDFTHRDEQFARVVGPMVRMFPSHVVATVRDLAALHALSEELDTAMALHLPDTRIESTAYRRAWQQVGRRGDRLRQIDLLLRIGGALDTLTRSTVLRHGLRAMRGPARAAGLGELQTFLESGFDTFRAIGGAEEFLSTVRLREAALCEALFSSSSVPGVTVPLGGAPVALDPLGQLP